MLHIHLFHVLMEPCYFLFQPPIIILNVTVIKARDLEAKDADGNICFIGGISACISKILCNLSSLACYLLFIGLKFSFQ